ncbi:50S ribosomal protein L25/general stress protein Ctc [Sedimentibacter sp. zth1]|uniref:50S ribosomal protein L25/general stress protein Ctc n=1 Tax=Sedimentibacter sp. zth1 TaxID=2816908 RepID=UPI001A93728C|nr:50S ribosomal protein L25/general stress protein Ctc [Sedimentibacter sp. zth1]QSX04974.1 50S ribosomal protein L25/general stress protein Ctc [Sedimentibacter sp. zth1]
MDIITVEKRNEKAKAKQLRRSGILPCCVYGGSLPEAISIQMDQITANKLFRNNREGSKIKLKLDEQIIPVQIKDKTDDLLREEIIHISFQALKADQKVNSITHIILKNTDKVKGILEKMLLEIPYAALPNDMIDTVSVDLDGLLVGSIITVGDIPEFKNENVDLQVDTDSIVLRVSETKQAVVESPETTEELQ